MRETEIPNKTSEGSHEVLQRQHKLASRERSLLIAIHGCESVAELREHFAALGDVDAMLQNLASMGLIEAHSVAVNDVDASAPTAAADTLAHVTQFINETGVAALGIHLVRAYLFTLKLQRCYTAAELRAFLPEFRRVLTRAKGRAFASAMVLRAERWLAQV